LSAFCSLLGRRCHCLPFLSVRPMGTHYPIWLFEMEILWMASAHGFALGPFLFWARACLGQPVPICACLKSGLTSVPRWPQTWQVLAPASDAILINRQSQLATHGPIAETRPSPRESTKPADLNPAAWRPILTRITPSLNKPFRWVTREGPARVVRRRPSGRLAHPADLYSTRRRVRRLFIRSRAWTTSSLSRTPISRCTVPVASRGPGAMYSPRMRLASSMAVNTMS
jgi:hypothetical protein